MKITKAQGLACLKELLYMERNEDAESIPMIGSRDVAFTTVWKKLAHIGEASPKRQDYRNTYMLAFALCAAIAGVKP